MQSKKSFVFYTNNKDVLELLSDEQLGKLLRMLIDFAETETLQNTDDVAINVAYRFMTSQMKRDFEKYETVCKRRSEAGKLGGRPKKQTKAKKANGFLEKQTKANESNEKQTKAKKADNDNDNENDNENECVINNTQPETPTLAQVQSYARSINGITNPERFHSFFSANGWKNKDGKPLHDWKAAYRYWNEQDKDKGTVSSAHKGKKDNIPESPMADAYRSLIYNIDE